MKNLNLCFTMIRRPINPESSPTTQNQDDHTRPFLSSTTQTSILIKNFNSLYDDHHNNNYTIDSCYRKPEPEPEPEYEPDFSTVFDSRRFFFTSPGRSNSIIEYSPSVTNTLPEDNATSSSSASVSSDQCLESNGHDQFVTTTIKDSFAVPTYSPDPYVDFRRSMQEMVEARGLEDLKGSWDYLHELLLCYLQLNPKSNHKFIIGAFADLLVTLISTNSYKKKETLQLQCGGEIV